MADVNGDVTKKAPLSPILLVEDDDNDRYLMQRAFTSAHVENPLVFAQNGEEAIHVLTQPSNSHTTQPGVLITDIKMPKIDGFELLLWLRTQPDLQTMPKLVISSSILEEDLAKSLQLGATAYFIKPHSHTALVRLVRYWKEAYFLAAAWRKPLEGRASRNG